MAPGSTPKSITTVSWHLLCLDTELILEILFSCGELRKSLSSFSTLHFHISPYSTTNYDSPPYLLPLHDQDTIPTINI
ncbi:unnamed protein product [Knipowitschia caucasica]|uniref:Uncharacterized protein n=1 Tax=Knipowitschia caucasica TaxID=637954 RepID=A0AAV2KYS8_KNICA